MFQQILAIVAPVILIALVGFLWARRRLPFDTNMVSDLVTNVGTPCLLFSTLLNSRPDPAILGQMMAAAFTVVFTIGVLGVLVLKLLKQPIRVFLPALTFSNVGNMGIPLCLFAFGEQGLALAVAFFAATSLLQFSVGVAVAAGTFTIATLVRMPILWGMAVAALLLEADITVPKWIMNTSDALAGLVIPLMLMSLGTSLARLKVAAFGRSFGFSLFRLGGGFVVAIFVCAVLGIEGPARGVVILQAAMPTAVFNYLFALRYGNRPEEVGGMVVISTVLSFLTLPLLLAFVLRAGQ